MNDNTNANGESELEPEAESAVRVKPMLAHRDMVKRHIGQMRAQLRKAIVGVEAIDAAFEYEDEAAVAGALQQVYNDMQVMSASISMVNFAVNDLLAGVPSD